MSRAARLALCLAALLLLGLVGCSKKEEKKPEPETESDVEEEEEKTEEPLAKTTEETPPQPEGGETAGVKSIFTFRPTEFTLSDAHSLSAEISLGFPVASDAPVAPDAAARLRKLFRTAVESAKGADLASDKGKEELRRQLLAAAQQELKAAPPSSLYFSGWTLGGQRPEGSDHKGEYARPHAAAGHGAGKGGRMLLTVRPTEDSGAH